MSSTRSTGQIFISYASADRDRAKRIAEAMQAAGYSVWWDRRIAAGQTFDEVIEHALDTAVCVVVLWSSTSVKSDWVKTEASEAASRGILVPALIDRVKILTQQPAAGTEIEPGGQTVLTVATISPRRVPGGERLFETKGQRSHEACRLAGLKWDGRQWSGSANTCTCEL